MNIDEVLQLVQDLRSQLDVWGVNSEALLAVGGVAALLFLLSTREVMTWFFRVNQVRDEVRELRGQMMELERLLKQTQNQTALHSSAQNLEVAEPIPPMNPEELMKAAEGLKEAPKFRLDH